MDNRNQKDITAATLTQIIFEKQKKSDAPVPLSTLRHIIQNGDGSFSSFLARGNDGNQLEVIRQLENQVRDLSTKLDSVERRAGSPGREAGAGVAKGAEA